MANEMAKEASAVGYDSSYGYASGYGYASMPSTTSSVGALYDVPSKQEDAYASSFVAGELSSEESEEESSVASIDIDFEETLTCTICQSTYTDPHILSCLHSFCKSCLSKHISTSKVRVSYGSNTIKCPLCRSEHSLSSKGVDDLTPNTQLARKVENLPENFETVQQQCDECEEPNVVSFCPECDIFLCMDCDKNHRKVKKSKSHVLVLPKQAKKKPKPKSFQCATHPTESLEVYCITCKSIVCRDCALYAHNGHKFKRAVEASDEIRKSLVSDSEELMAKLRTFRSHAEAVAKVEKHVTTYPDNLKAFITAQFEELHKMLEKRKEALLKEVDTQYNGFSKTLWVEKDIVETSICKLEAGIKFAQQVAKSQDKLEVAVLGNKAITSMRQMRKTLYWDPKAIKNLGPVGYAAQGSDEYQEYIEKIGILKNMEISISDKGYNGYQSYDDFTKNGTYYVEVEVNFGNNVEALFPQMSISCTCKTGKGSVSCSIKQQQQQGKWMVTFQTVNPGTYTIMATLKISGEDYRVKTETIYLYECIRIQSPCFSAEKAVTQSTIATTSAKTTIDLNEDQVCSSQDISHETSRQWSSHAHASYTKTDVSYSATNVTYSSTNVSYPSDNVSHLRADFLYPSNNMHDMQENSEVGENQGITISAGTVKASEGNSPFKGSYTYSSRPTQSEMHAVKDTVGWQGKKISRRSKPSA